MSKKIAPVLQRLLRLSKTPVDIVLDTPEAARAELRAILSVARAATKANVDHDYSIRDGRHITDCRGCAVERALKRLDKVSGRTM
jgi:hypothetical protein